MKGPIGRLLVLALAGALVVAGCTGPTDPTPPADAAGAQSSRKPVYTVRRGSIAEAVTVPGRIASQDEVSLSFRDGGRVGLVLVELNKRVLKGATLAERHRTARQPDRSGEARWEIAAIRLERALAMSGPSSRAALLTAAAEVGRAEAAHQAALATIDAIDSDHAVEAQAARSAVDRAGAFVRSNRATLAELQAGPSPELRRTASQAVAAARAGLEEREAGRAKAAAGPSEEQTRQTELAVEQAKALLLAAQYERDSTNADPRASEPSRRAGDARVAAAEAAVAEAATRLQAVKSGPDPRDVAAAEAAVRRAQADVGAAEARLAELGAGRQTAAARGALDAAEADYRAAAARHDRLDDTSRVSQSAAAQRNLTWATTSLEAARASHQLLVARGSGSDDETLLERKSVERAQVILDQLERQAENARIRAPFEGTVTAISLRQGDAVQAYAPVVVLANPAHLDVAAHVNRTDIARIALGQEASVTLKTPAGPTLPGRVAALPPPTQSLSTTAGRTVRVALAALGAYPEIGTPADVVITLATRDDTLLAPTGAILRHSGRQYVQVLGDDGRRREVSVQTGIASGRETEILKGLSDGQRLLGQ